MARQRHIFITGATDGIGRELAAQYRAQGQQVWMLGRKPLSELDQSFFTESNYVQVDLAQPDAAERVRRFLETQPVRYLDLFIHNAGTGFYGATAVQEPHNIHMMLAVNLYAPIALTHAAWPWVNVVEGKFVFISSVMSGLPGPDYAVYTATKGALEGFARSLRAESHKQVGVQIIRPGATYTGMHEKMGISQDEMNWSKFPSAAKVAGSIIKAIASSRPTVTIGKSNKMIHFVGRHSKPLLDNRMRKSHGNVEPDGPSVGKGRQWCVITGAAAGIGKALAQRFAQEGFGVVGVDIDMQQIVSTQAEFAEFDSRVRMVQADVTTNAGRQAIISAIQPFAPLAVFIHNAGINYVGSFPQTQLPRQQKVLDVNLEAPLLMTSLLLHERLLTDSGTFIFMASLSNYVSYPGAAVYAATKDGIAAYARSLRVALGAKRNVLTVYPGPTRTAHARRYSPDNSREAARMPPEELAAGVYTAFKKRQQTFIPGINNRLFAAVGEVWPGGMEFAMRKTILDKLDDELM